MVPEGWGRLSLGEFTCPKQWPTISKAEFTQEGFPVFGANGIIGRYSRYNHEKPAIVVTCRGATCGEVNMTPPMSYITGNAMALDNIDSSKADPFFLFYALKHRGLFDIVSGSAQPQIIGKDIKAVRVNLPPLPEQRKIAQVLSTWDRAVELTEVLLAAARTRKRGLMQILLTGKCRFPEFEGQEWREVRLGEVVSLSKERLDPRKEHEACRCIELEHIESKTGRLLGSAQSNQQASIKAVFNPGDVLFGKLRPYLRKFIAPDFKGVCSTEIWVLQPKTQAITSCFLHCLIQSDGFMAEAEKSSGSRMPRADWKIVSEYCCFLPKLNEQHRIASTIDLCAQEVNALTSKIERLHTEKKALMQKLLTGKWRVKVDA